MFFLKSARTATIFCHKVDVNGLFLNAVIRLGEKNIDMNMYLNYMVN